MGVYKSISLLDPATVSSLCGSWSDSTQAGVPNVSSELSNLHKSIEDTNDNILYVVESLKSRMATMENKIQSLESEIEILKYEKGDSNFDGKSLQDLF